MDKKFFDENGYYIDKNLIPIELINQFVDDLNKIFKQQIDFLDKNSQDLSVFDKMRLLFNMDNSRYLSTLTLSSKMVSLYDIIIHKNVQQSVNDLGFKIPVWQTRPVIHCMSNDLKIQNGYHGVGVHQDWSTLQSSLNTITIWIPFFKVTKENFPIEVIPKTHLLGLCEGSQKEHFFEIDSSYYNMDEFIELEAEPGDVIFMSNFTIHKSKTTGKGFRMSVSMRYEDGGEDTFIERNYPFTEKRIVNRDVLFKDFPKKEQVLKIYNKI